MAIVKSVASAKQTGSALESMLRNMPEFEDFKPLLSDKALSVVEAKEAELEEARRYLLKMERKADVLKKEILRLAGGQIAELKSLQRAMLEGRKSTTIRVADIWSIIVFDTTEVPGADEYEKKRNITKQKELR